MSDILMVTAMAGAENCAAALSRLLQLGVDTAAGRREAMALLKSHAYQVVIVDESMVNADDDGSDALFRTCGTAVPLEINFAISGHGRVVRAVRAALIRRELEKRVGAHAAAFAMKSELREMVSGLLLHSELAATEPAVPEALAARLRTIEEIAISLRKRLDAEPTPLCGSLPSTMSLRPLKPAAGPDLKTAAVAAGRTRGTTPVGGVPPMPLSNAYALGSSSQ
jgi:hypothetical protein